MNHKVFFDHVRAPLFGGALSRSQVAGCEALLAAVAGWDLRWQAYALATAYGETARTMRPIAEYGRGRGRRYGRPGRHGGQVAYGRGYVQLTWDANYEKADRELGLDGALIADFDLALRPDIAARILRRGMEEGWFTGRKLGDYFTPDKSDWKHARRIINRLDRAARYASWAQTFHRALEAAGVAADPVAPRQTPATDRSRGRGWLARLLTPLLSLLLNLLRRQS